MSHTGSGTSVVCGQNHSIFFPVQLNATPPSGLVMTWTHGVGEFAYYVALHEVVTATPSITGSGVDVARDTAIVGGGFVVTQPDVNTIVVTSNDTGGTQMFIMEAKFQENSQELDLVGVTRSGVNIDVENDPRVVIS